MYPHDIVYQSPWYSHVRCCILLKNIKIYVCVSYIPTKVAISWEHLPFRNSSLPKKRRSLTRSTTPLGTWWWAVTSDLTWRMRRSTSSTSILGKWLSCASSQDEARCHHFFLEKAVGSSVPPIEHGTRRKTISPIGYDMAPWKTLIYFCCHTVEYCKWKAAKTNTKRQGMLAQNRSFLQENAGDI